MRLSRWTVCWGRLRLARTGTLIHWRTSPERLGLEDLTYPGSTSSSSSGRIIRSIASQIVFENGKNATGTTNATPTAHTNNATPGDVGIGDGEADDQGDEQGAEAHDGVDAEVAGPVALDAFESQAATRAAIEHPEPPSEQVALTADRAVLDAAPPQQSASRRGSASLRGASHGPILDLLAVTTN